MLTVNSDEASDDQPLDFSQKAHSDIKDSHPFAWKKDVDKHIFTTPSPSPPESQSQVLCQLLSSYANKVKSELNGHSNHESLITSASGSGNSDCYSTSNGSSNGSAPFKSDLRHNIRKSTPNVIASDSPISPLASLLDSTSPLIASQALALVSSNPASFMANANNLLTTAPSFFDPKKKYTRPFKAYPSSRDIGLTSLYNMPLHMSPDTSGHNLLASTSGPEYLQFRAHMLSQKRSASDGRRKSSPGCATDTSLSPNTCSSLENGPTGGSRRKNSTCSNSNRSTSGNLSDDSNQHSSCGEGESGSTNSTSSSVVGGGGGGGKNTSGNGLTGHSNISAENATGPLLATPAKLNGTQGQTSEDTNGSSTQAAQATTTTPSSGRKRGRPLPDEQKDEAYWERRRKNNEAAKRSRDARRAKEDEIAIRAAFLENENIKLRLRIAQLESELTKVNRAMSLNN